MGAVFTLCCLADAFVLRSAWTGRYVESGQFRRGYFEDFAGTVGLAMDNAIRPVFPDFLLTARGELGVPPGVTALVPLVPGTVYQLAADSPLAPYVLIGVEAPVAPPPHAQAPTGGEARLGEPRTLALQGDALALVAWDGARPWAEDSARLSALRAKCAAAGDAPPLSVAATDEHIAVRLGRCALAAPLMSGAGTRPLLAALAGPDWVRIGRQPAWSAQRWLLWQVLAAIVIKVAATWWGLGLPSAVASSAVLVIAAIWLPVAAMLTWPVTSLVGLGAAAVRAAAWALRALPARLRAASIVAALALASYGVMSKINQPHSFPGIIHAHSDRGQPDTCAIIGYSTAGGASLRRNGGGPRWFLDEDCAPCRDATASLTAGGEVMDWTRDAYCTSPASFGTDGQVIFYGGANDDFLWGLTSMARLFVIGQQTIDRWQSSQAPAIAASLARIDAQASAVEETVRCARSRGSQFLYLHDFLVTDLVAGRDSERAAMLARRRDAVEAAGGTFIDLYQRFAAEAGVSWFNDYIHPSLIAHQRFAELACRGFHQ